MIKTIFWDFDGVILDSMKIKSDGFKALFPKESKEVLKEIERYHYTYGGVSRFDKIRYFYETILGETIADEKVEILAEEFGKIIAKKIFDKKNLISESILFIKQNYKKYSFHIVSGAEENELNALCEYFDLSKYFITINGSPTKKDVLIKNILKKYRYNKEDSILIGDAMTDYNASVKNSIGFYGYNNLELKEVNYIESFEGFQV